MIATAIITAFLANGITCAGAPVASSTATTPRFNVSLCVTHSVPLCGLSYRFVRTNAAGTLRINSRQQVTVADLTASAQAFPFAIPSASAALTHRDLGLTPVDIRVPLAPATKRLIATYNISVLASKPATSYAFRLDAAAVAISPDGRCGALPDGPDPHKSYPVMLPIEQPIAASFTLNKK